MCFKIQRLVNANLQEWLLNVHRKLQSAQSQFFTWNADLAPGGSRDYTAALRWRWAQPPVFTAVSLLWRGVQCYTQTTLHKLLHTLTYIWITFTWIRCASYLQHAWTGHHRAELNGCMLANSEIVNNACIIRRISTPKRLCLCSQTLSALGSLLFKLVAISIHECVTISKASLFYSDLKALKSIHFYQISPQIQGEKTWNV